MTILPPRGRRKEVAFFVVLALIQANVVTLAGFTADHWVNSVTWITGLYFGANVGTKWANNGSRSMDLTISKREATEDDHYHQPTR